MYNPTKMNKQLRYSSVVEELIRFVLLVLECFREERRYSVADSNRNEAFSGQTARCVVVRECW